MEFKLWHGAEQGVPWQSSRNGLSSRVKERALGLKGIKEIWSEVIELMVCKWRNIGSWRGMGVQREIAEMSHGDGGITFK